MSPEDLYELRIVGDPRLSPDGRTVAYVLTSPDKDVNEYRSEIWIVPVDGSAQPRPFTAGGRRDASPRWSPDGTSLAFVSNRDSDHMQLYVIPASGGEARKLTDLGEDVEEPAWSPGGDRVAFSTRVPEITEADEHRRPPLRITRLRYKLDNKGWLAGRRQHVFVVAADGSSAPTQITGGDYEDESPAWSPDGDRIAFASARHDDWDIDTRSDIYVVGADGGTPERITALDGACGSPSWSPDGTRIAYLYTPGVWDEPRHGRVAVVDVASGKRTMLTESLDRNCSPYPPFREPIWMGEQVLFAVEDHGNTHLYIAPADGTVEPSAVVRDEQRVTGYDLVTGHSVHTATTYTSPPELFYGDRQLTRHGSDFSQRLLPAERFPAGDVDAWIIRPAGFEAGKRYPALLNIHGGPFTQYGTGFFDEFQVYAGAGYVVLYANPRGSSGYAEEWGRAIRGPSGGIGPGWGTVDYEDLMTVVDEALRRFDFIDPERLGVMGGSYGGFMTTWIVGHSNRFKAAISERAVNNWVSQWGSSDVGPFFKGEIGSHIYEDFDAWVRMSPATYAKDISTPLLILHSENDLRCPIEQAEHLFHTLRMLRKEVEFIRFPAESHELSRSGAPVHRVMRLEVILDWFARRL
jgi:dipeptidyl aminopeptidase/acylaminoacyl peptidase